MQLFAGIGVGYSKIGTISVVNKDIDLAPKTYSISQNFPNPFNPSTVITYSIPVSSNVIINVYNVLGELIRTLVNENQEAGIYKVNFDAQGLSNGVYFYKIQAGNYTETKKMLLLK
jgi:hypothetical protein